MLENKKVKIYAGNTANQTVAVFGSLRQNGVITYSDDPDLIQNENYENGYDASLIAGNAQPKGDQSSPLYVMSRELAYLQQVGLKGWLDTVEYVKGSIVILISDTGKPTLYYSKTDNNIGNNPATDTDNWEELKLASGSGSSKNIGEIVYSILPINDTGMHLADGSLLSKEGTYKNFYDYLLNIYNSGVAPNLFTDELTWQTINTQNEFCPKFVLNNGVIPLYAFSRTDENGKKSTYYSPTLENEYTTACSREFIDKYGDEIMFSPDSEDNRVNGNISTNSNGDKTFTIDNRGTPGLIYIRDAELDKLGYASKTRFRLPNLTGYIKGATTVADLGNIQEAGLPNITGVNDNSAYNPKGAFYGETSLGGGHQSTNPYNPEGLGFDASRSNPIYGRTTNTIEIQSSNVLVYICITNTVSEEVSAIKDYEVYNTVPLGCPIYSDHMLNDVNYLLSNNQWNDGSVYEAMYNLLLSEYNNLNSVEITSTIGNTEITYKKTPNGFFITKDEASASIIFNSNRVSFWVIDTTSNGKFKLPQNTKRELIESWKDDNGNYYNLYSDGWVEQGGYEASTNTVQLNKIMYLSIKMKDTNYLVQSTNNGGIAGGSGLGWDGVSVSASANYNKTQETFSLYIASNASTMGKYWKVEGYADPIAIANKLNPAGYLYYKVGNTTVNADLINIDQLTTTLTKKVDNDGKNAKFPIITETYSDDDGNWYRIYSDGWCEQGGISGNIPRAGINITLLIPVQMNSSIFTFTKINSVHNEFGLTGYQINENTIKLFLGGYEGSQPNFPAYWEVKGKLSK